MASINYSPISNVSAEDSTTSVESSNSVAQSVRSGMSASRKATLIGITSLSALLFAACSSPSESAESYDPGDSEDSAVTETVLETTVTETEITTEKPDSSEEESTEEKSSESESDVQLEAEITDALSGGLAEGDTFTAGGEEWEACLVGDGYGLNTVAAAEGTSCEFALEIMRTQTRDLNATDNNIRTYLSPDIKVYSKVTAQSYNVKCAEQSDGVIICTGGENAKVLMN